MKRLLEQLLILFLSPLCLMSCDGDSDDNDKLQSIYAEQILGSWYQDPDGWELTFDKTKCTQKLWNGKSSTHNYTLIGNHLTVENWSSISGEIKYIDNYKLVIKREGLSDFNFKRQPNPGWNNDNSGSGNNNSSSGDQNDNNSNKPPFENYIHYRYCQTDYFHEICFVKQEVELAAAGTIHGWNWKYLNVYIGNSVRRIGFQFESTYYEDEYPPTTPWPAMEYNITSTSGSAITHFPIARVFVYNDAMALKTHYPTVGVGKIKYVGNKLIFDFTSNEKSSDYYVKVHFEGNLSY